MDAQQGVPSDTYVDARLQAVLAAGVYKIAYDVAFAIAPFYCFQAIWVYIALPESETCSCVAVRMANLAPAALAACIHWSVSSLSGWKML